MSAPSDFSYEMPDEPAVDDAPAPFAEEVRFAVSGPPPAPSHALAEVLAVGFSGPYEKGDLPATAASNVHGPARQAAGLPNWKEERDMAVPGVLAGLLAKLSGAGTAAKAALAGVTAVTTMGLAGAAAGVLPDPAQNAVAAAVGAATPFELPDAGDATGVVERAVGSVPQVTVTTPTIPALPVQPPVSVSAGVTAGSTRTSTPAVTTPTVPNVSIPSVPNVSVPPAVSGLVNGLPTCVRELVPTTGTTPDPTALVAKIQACIPQILSTANLPPQVAACVSSVLGTIGGAAGMSVGSIPGLSGLNLSACVPMDASKCITNLMSFFGTIPGFGSGSIPGVGSISNLPGLSGISGCVPMDVQKCITSITSAVSAGTVPRLDLSACMPTTLPGTGTLPGFGSFTNLPGLSGALPFFGR